MHFIVLDLKELKKHEFDCLRNKKSSTDVSFTFKHGQQTQKTWISFF